MRNDFGALQPEPGYPRLHDVSTAGSRVVSYGIRMESVEVYTSRGGKYQDRLGVNMYINRSLYSRP